MARAFARMRQLQGEPTFEYYGNTGLSCAANSYSRRTTVEVGGMQVDADLVLWVPRSLAITLNSTTVTIADDVKISDHKPYPKAGRKLTFTGRTFRIEAVMDPYPWDEEHGWLGLVCIDPSQ